jgi:diguanylate cyclase (GGDEF)-like protein/PAS domain S-box-containing protein
MEPEKKSERLLVVDDDPRNRDMLARRLERQGYAVETAGDGRTAKEMIDAGMFDLVLLDQMMPGMSGLDLLKLLRAMHSPDELPVIMVTALDQSEALVAALAEGANDYVTKPVDFPAMAARVRAQLARKRDGEMLRASEERYSLAISGANEGVWDWNLETNQVYYSDRWKAIVGYGEEEIGDSPKEWLDRIHPRDRESVERVFAAGRTGVKHEFESEHRLRGKDGGFRWVLARGAAVRVAGNGIVRMAGSLADISERKRYDRRTGIFNRFAFEECLESVLDWSRQEPDYRFAALIVDLDDFRVVNHTLGVPVGDRLLVQVAERISHCLRSVSGDSVFGPLLSRLRGDDFGILIDSRSGGDTDRAAMELAGEIQGSLSEPFLLEGREVYASVSGGIAGGPAKYNRPEDVLRDADLALNNARAAGRSQCSVFTASMRRRAMEKAELETDLRRALERNQMVVFYQPKVRLSNRTVAGFEALIRWRHPGHGLVSPGDFIPIAETTGFIVPLGEWVLAEACRQLKQWQERFPRTSPLTMSVNLSAKQLLQPDLVERVERILIETGVPAESLRLEVTETLLVSDPDEAARLLGQLKSLRVGLKLDDFGTGYSSLSYLHRFPFDTLKIDRSFVMSLPERAESRAIIRTITNLARSLKLGVVAEGVETPEQLSELLEMGCDYGQGYLFSRPLTAVEAERLLEGP